jgi:hypothetical protein
MTQDQMDTFEKLVGQLDSVYDEISLLSKKSPNDAVSKFKLNFINAMLEASNNFLGNRYRPSADFNKFDEGEIPQYSDVVFVISQYIQSFEKLRADNVEVDYEGHWFWVLKDAPDASGEPKRVRTTRPKRLRE